jgi:hypothetical protein
MDVDNNANEAFLDSVERQAWSLTAIGESRADFVPANIVPHHTDETLEVAPATVLPSGGARNGPNSPFEKTSCKACGAILMGQDVCDSCAGVLDAEPSSWFNG